MLGLFVQRHWCFCVVPTYVDVVIMYAPLTVGTSPCLCNSVVWRSVCVCVDKVYIYRTMNNATTQAGQNDKQHKS